MPEYVTVNIDKTEKDALQATASEAAAKLGLKKLSLAQLIHLMHEQYKERHNI